MQTLIWESFGVWNREPEGAVSGSKIVGRNILTLGEGFNTQVLTIWCCYVVGREILTLGEGFNTQVITLWCFYIVWGAGF